MEHKAHEEVFQETVPQLFGFLVSEFGFSLAQEDDWLFEAESKDASMGIFLDKGGQVVVTFRPFDEADRRLPESLKYLRGSGRPDVAVIVECLDPHASVEFKRETRPEDIEGELAKYVVILRKYCTPFLAGDFSDWHIVEDCLKKRDKKLSEWLESGNCNVPPQLS